MFRFAALVPVCLVAALAAGCAPGKAGIEKSIRDEMKSSLGVEITKVDLDKQADGTFSGTATAANGDTYDVTTSPPKGGKVEWKAVVAKNTIERMLRDHIKTSLKAEVTALELNKQPDGTYSGTATTAPGNTYEVTASAPKVEGVMLNAVPAQSYVERLVREDIEKKSKVKVMSLDLTRQGPGTYTGTAALANGAVLAIGTKMDGPNLTWTFEPVE